ncbi:MAG: hypothetical protein KGV44_01530 [Flavobacteriaceae bacterium]|nr:hypothetical protein [Flavobacteriaceae bacterium]
MKTSKMIFVISLLFLYSCNNEDNLPTEKINGISTEFVKVEKGRLHFSSKDFLHKKINEFKNKGRKFASKELAKLYNKDFYSLRPIISDNENIMQKFANRKLKNRRLSARSNSELNENMDELEDLIGDDEFASFINDEGEIQVGDSIYKYTKRGLFFVHQNDMEHLNNYLESNQLTTNDRFAYRSAISSPCDYNRENAGLVQINERITRYIHPLDDCNSGDYYGGGGGGSYQPSNSSNDFHSFIENLPKNEGEDGSFDFLFGKSRTCIEKFSSGYRVKTKFWNQSYLIYRSIGVSVRHQKKFLFWWTVDTDEIALGINQVYFEYDLPTVFKPEMPKEDFFICNGEVYTSQARYIRSVYGDTPLPSIFNESLVVVVDLSQYSIYKVSGKQINKLVWDKIWGTAKSLLKKLKKPEPKKITLVGFTSQKVVVNYVNISERETDEGSIRKIFDWQVGLGVGFGIDSDGGIDFNGASLPNLYSYDKVKIDVYGVARRGNTWKGSRLVYKD